MGSQEAGESESLSDADVWSVGRSAKGSSGETLVGSCTVLKTLDWARLFARSVLEGGGGCGLVAV